jgi:phosphoribosylglycinamide formyltransferase 2
MSEAALGAAKSVAARMVRALGGRGVFGVEVLVRGDEVYFSDVSVRPHDSGLVTLRTQRLSEFELHARAVLGLPVDAIMISPGAAAVWYSGAESAEETTGPLGDRPDPAGVLADVLEVPESDVRIFGHHEGAAQRRLGLALATAGDVTTARDRVRRASTALRKLWHP